MAVVDELVAELTYQLKGQENLRKFTQGVDGAESRLAKFAKRAGAVAALAATAVAGIGVAFGRSVIQTSAEFERYGAVLETITGSADEAARSLDWISEFAKKTPYEVADLTDAFVKMKAYGLDPMNGSLEILGDTASAMGKPLMQAVEAFADAATGEFERLKEFGIKAKTEGDNVTFAWTKNGKNVTETVKKNSEEIRKFLLETFGDRFQGAMERQSRTWQGMMSNLADIWTDFQRRVGDAGFFDVVRDQLDRLLDWIKQLDADGTLDRWAQNLSNGLTWMAENTEFLIKRTGKNLATLAEIWTNFTDWIAETFEGLGGEGSWGGEAFTLAIAAIGAALVGLAVAMFPIIFGIPLLLVALDDFLAWFRGEDSIIGKVIDEWSADFDRLVEALGELKEGISKGLDNLKADMLAKFAEIKDSILSLDWVQLGIDIMTAIWEGFKSVGGAIRDWFASLFDGISISLPDLQTLGSAGRFGQTGISGVARDRGAQGPVTRNTTVNSTVNQTVTGATAPGAAARATSEAVGQAATSGAARIEETPMAP